MPCDVFRRAGVRVMVLVSALVLGASPACGAEQALPVGSQWGQWRGPLGTGAAVRGDLPVTWGEGHNVRWKTPLPGRGLSTPVIWGDRIFVTTAIAHGERLPVNHPDAPGAHDNVPALRAEKFTVIALDRDSGQVVWQRTVRDARPHEGTHATGSWASNSAITDGERVYAFFGSEGLFALDMDGRLLWQVDPGDMQTLHGHGEGSSPALHGDTLVINWDHQGQSFVVALDRRTGKQRWKVKRDEVTSWSTPLIVDNDGRAQVIISATGRVRSYDLATGALIWECAGLSRNVVASPVAADGVVYVASSYDYQAMMAIRLAGARGDVTGTDAVIWTRHRDTPYVPSPVLDGGTLCFLKHLSGILTCVDAATGKTLAGPMRLPGVQNVFASPVSAAGRVYIVGRNGVAVVVGRGGKFPVLAVNRLDDSFSASPAVVGKSLYLRGDHHLYRIAAEPGP
ncbi:MAG: PQQ-binding-like beta-propeller repeat protein [Acidobacteriota bacterium]